MDIAIEVMITPNANYSAGDFVNAYPATQMGIWDGSQYTRDISQKQKHTGYIFVTGVPDIFVDPVLQIIRTKLMGEEASLSAKRRWHAAVADIPVAVRTAFINNGYANFTWTQVKNYVKRKDTNALLTDTDLSG